MSAQTAVRQLARSLSVGEEFGVVPTPGEGDPDGDRLVSEALQRRLAEALAKGDREWATTFVETAVRAIEGRYRGETPRTESFVDGQFFPGVCARLLNFVFPGESGVVFLVRGGEDGNLRSDKKRRRTESVETPGGASTNRDERAWARAVGKLALAYLGCLVPPSPVFSSEYREPPRRLKRGMPLADSIVKYVWTHSEWLCDGTWLAECLPKANAALPYLMERGLLTRLGSRFGAEEVAQLLCSMESEASVRCERAARVGRSGRDVGLRNEGERPHDWEPFSCVLISVGKLAMVRDDVRRAALRFCAQSVVQRPFLWNAHSDFREEEDATTTSPLSSLSLSPNSRSDRPCYVLERLLSRDRTASRESNERVDVERDDGSVVRDLVAAALWTDNVDVLRRLHSTGCLTANAFSSWRLRPEALRTARFCATHFPTEYARAFANAERDDVGRTHASRKELRDCASGKTGRTPFCDLLLLAWASHARKPESRFPDERWDRVAGILLSALARGTPSLGTAAPSTERDWFRCVHRLPDSWWADETRNISRIDELALACGCLSRESFDRLREQFRPNESPNSSSCPFLARAFFANGRVGAGTLSSLFVERSGLATAASTNLVVVERWLELQVDDRRNEELWTRLFPGAKSDDKRFWDVHARPLTFARATCAAARDWNWGGFANPKESLEIFCARVWTCAVVLSVLTRPRLDVSILEADETEFPKGWRFWQRVGKRLPPGRDFWFSRALATALFSRMRSNPLGRFASEDLLDLVPLAIDARCNRATNILGLVCSEIGRASEDRASWACVYGGLAKVLAREDVRGVYFRATLEGGGRLDELCAGLELLDEDALTVYASLVERSRAYLESRNPETSNVPETRPGRWLCVAKAESPLLPFALALEEELRAREMHADRLALWRVLGVRDDSPAYVAARDYPFPEDSLSQTFPCRACLLDFQPGQLLVLFSCAHPVHLACAHAHSLQIPGRRKTLGCPWRCADAFLVADYVRVFSEPVPGAVSE